MTDLWSFLLQTLTASGAAVLLLVLKAMFRDKLSPRWQFAVWGVLAILLLLPAGRGGRYVLVNWPFYVELLRSTLTGEYGALAHVAAPVPLPGLSLPRSWEEWLFALYVLGAAFFLVRYIVGYIRLRLALAVPLTVGARAAVGDPGLAGYPARMAYARTVPCTTYAGAIDTYAKAVMTWRRDYRAMCAPLSEQNQLAKEQVHFWKANGQEDILNNVENASGYQFRNLVQVDENTYEGLLVLELNNPPGRPKTGDDYIWLAVQRLRAEKEGERWVVIPQEDFWATEAYGWKSWPSSCDELPAWEYEARSGDFILRLRRQTTSAVDSYEQEGNQLFGTRQVFVTEPQPNGSFDTYYYQHLEAEYTGSPEDKGKYTSLGVSSRPVWGEARRPELEPLTPPENHPDATDWTGSSNQGSGWSSATLGVNWESPVFLGGGGSSVGEDPFARPSAYAVDFYVNGEKAAELTLLPVEGGMSRE